jgi:hypothetical protein
MKRSLMAAVLLAGTALVSPASADAIKFYVGGGAGYDGPLEGSGSVGNKGHDRECATNCTVLGGIQQVRRS